MLKTAAFYISVSSVPILPKTKNAECRYGLESEQCHDFVMEERDGAWKMVQTALPPQWIVQLEAQLRTVICEYQLKSPAVPSKFRMENHGKTGS